MGDITEYHGAIKECHRVIVEYNGMSKDNLSGNEEDPTLQNLHCSDSLLESSSLKDTHSPR